MEMLTKFQFPSQKNIGEKLMKTEKTLKIDRNNLTNENRKEIRNQFKNTIEEKVKVKTWIKTLLYSYKILPKVINVIDEIILSRASNYSFSADIFNDINKPKNQFNLVIDMSERKQKLINIFVMTKNLLKSLSKENYELIYGKIYQMKTNDKLAEEYGVSKRTIFRRINAIIDKLYLYTLENKWTLRFIEIQVGEELWLKERYNHFLDELVIDIVK